VIKHGWLRFPLIEFCDRGTHLRGCLSCNEWHDNKGNRVQLSVED